MLYQNFIYFILFIFLKINLSLQICIKGENHCSKCNYMTKLCVKCDLNIYTPDKDGGCELIKTCYIGKNNCIECSDDSYKCKKCENGYFPDENGGCSYTDNCKISYKGECLECMDDYILLGKDVKHPSIKNNFILCKSLSSEDLKNCKEINMLNGVCTKCKEGFYLNSGDNRCTETENCLESSFGLCTKCIRNYYLNKKENKCIKQEDIFYKCQETIDGQNCDICDENFYLAKDGKCSQNNFCSKVGNSSECSECISGYYSSEYHSICSLADNCYLADTDTGLCLSCLKDFCLDYKDGKCKSNKENNKFKHCRTADDNCFDCIYPYFLGEDLKCASTRYCAESENSTCLLCIENYYLGLDNKCTDVENCIYSNEFHCIQCIDNYYYNIKTKKCVLETEKYINCQMTDYFGENCDKCRNGFYLNKVDYLCYDNNEKGNFYKCEKTDFTGEHCEQCVENYYLGKNFKKCTKFKGCEESSDEKKCDLCDEDHVLNVKEGICKINDKIIDESKLYYYKCNRTNEEGTECEICINGYILNNNGLCVDNSHCIEEKEDICQKCEKKEGDNFNYCLNKVLGCIKTQLEGCLECDDVLDFNKCSKCLDNYVLNDKNTCDEIKEEEN